MAANYTKYNDDVVMNQSWHYSNCYDVWEVRPDLIEILEKHDDDKYCILEKLYSLKTTFYYQRKKNSQPKYQVVAKQRY